MKALPPRYFQIALALIFVFHYVFPQTIIYHSSIRFFGIIPIIIGIWLNLKSDALIKKYHTTIKPFEEPSYLVISGPFCFSRNPIYLGMVLIILGAAIISGAAPAFLLPLILMAILHFKFILKEEKNMINTFGDDYIWYKNNVHRWL